MHGVHGVQGGHKLWKRIKISGENKKINHQSFEFDQCPFGEKTQEMGRKKLTNGDKNSQKVEKTQLWWKKSQEKWIKTH